ncbi:hypothetical protein C8R45DRAFT_1184909 [Mycena sanguinolenta]|nr:hypothetical protein C8R45DRAFT_1184909 [Mycena sanguinolenta]
MPTPAGGFPRILFNRELLRQGMTDTLQALHDGVDDPNKFYVVVSGGNGAVMRTHSLIRQTLGDYINLDPSAIQLGTPPTSENGPSPILWLVAGIPAHLARRILAKPTRSTAAITLYPIPYEIPVTGFWSGASTECLTSDISGSVTDHAPPQVLLHEALISNSSPRSFDESTGSHRNIGLGSAFSIGSQATHRTPQTDWMIYCFSFRWNPLIATGSALGGSGTPSARAVRSNSAEVMTETGKLCSQNFSGDNPNARILKTGLENENSIIRGAVEASTYPLPTQPATTTIKRRLINLTHSNSEKSTDLQQFKARQDSVDEHLPTYCRWSGLTPAKWMDKRDLHALSGTTLSVL